MSILDQLAQDFWMFGKAIYTEHNGADEQLIKSRIDPRNVILPTKDEPRVIKIRQPNAA